MSGCQIYLLILPSGPKLSETETLWVQSIKAGSMGSLKYLSFILLDFFIRTVSYGESRAGQKRSWTWGAEGYASFPFRWLLKYAAKVQESITGLLLTEVVCIDDGHLPMCLMEVVWRSEWWQTLPCAVELRLKWRQIPRLEDGLQQGQFMFLLFFLCHSCGWMFDGR